MSCFGCTAFESAMGLGLGLAQGSKKFVLAYMDFTKCCKEFKVEVKSMSI